MAYRLALPKRLKLHLVFHIFRLKKFYEDADLEQKWEARAPPEVRAQFDRELDRILDCQTRGTCAANRRTKFLMHWRGDKSLT